MQVLLAILHQRPAMDPRWTVFALLLAVVGAAEKEAPATARVCAADDGPWFADPKLIAHTVLTVLVLALMYFSGQAKAKFEAQERKRRERLPTPAQTLALVKARRSVFPKDYDGTKPGVEVVARLLEAANWAPTHGKTEPWRFVVLSDDGLRAFYKTVERCQRDALGEDSEAYKKWKAKQDRKAADREMLAYLICIGMKRQANPDKLMPEWEEISAVACAVQNLHLMATSLNVQGYWSSGGGYTQPAVCDELGWDSKAGDRCLGVFHVGMAPSDTVARYRSKRQPIRDKVTWRL